MPGKVVPIGGGGFGDTPTPALDAWLIGLSGVSRPRVLFIPTATGDHPDRIVRFYQRAAEHDCVPGHLELFRRTVDDLREHVLRHDLILVGGGNTASMLAVWRAHGLDRVLREAWEAGRVLAGASAGAICWFEGGTTDSFGTMLAPLTGGLGLLAGSFCPHYDSEVQRRPVFQALVESRRLPSGYAADDRVALLFEDSRLADVVTDSPGAGAYRVEVLEGKVVEHAHEARSLV